MKDPVLTLAAAALCTAAGSVCAQGVLKPVEAVIVNPDSRPVPVVDKALATAVKALAAPALMPYQETARFNQGSGLCTQFNCELTFSPVPAGKRLVVTHVSAVFAAGSPSAFVFVELTDSSHLPALLLPAPPTSTTPGLQISSSPVTFYVDAGKSPLLRLVASGIGNLSTPATASVIGHLVDVP
jgi:hypothetical protein